MATTLSKPAGLPVFPPHADPAGDCLLARLLREEPARAAIAWPEGYEGGIAHRLDTSTSGAVWVADDPDELRAMRERFTGRALVKTYVLRAARVAPWGENTCEAPLAHDRRRRDRMIAQRGRDTPHRGRWMEADTRFVHLGGALYEARMRTGVMHQIRAHAAFLGIPILGDRLYGGGPTPEGAPDGLSFYLHHVGLVDAAGWGTAPVPLPPWAA